MLVNVTSGEEAALARAEFDFTADDLLDVLQRSPHFMAKLGKRCRRLVFLVTIPLWTGVILLSGWLLGAPLPVLIGAPGGVAVALLLQVPVITRHIVARRLQSIVARAMRGAPTQLCVVELLESGCRIEQHGRRLVQPWAELPTLRERDGDVEFVGESLLVVRARAFATPAARAEFVAIARELQAAARA